MLTRAQLVLIDSGIAFGHLDLDGICAELDIGFTIPLYGINTLQRRAAFIAQLCMESWHFSRVTENLNYSAEGLLNTFPSHFTNVIQANEYSHQPERIANRVYANRMGNGNEASGDGWLFRGRGLIQLTGRYMYTAFHQEGDPDYLATTTGAVDSAFWFYAVKHNLNPLADAGDIAGITKIINGGTNGLADRIRFYNNALKILTP